MSQPEQDQWLFRRSPALLVSLNEDGFFVDASDAWLRRFGYAREEIATMRPQDLSSTEGAKRIVEEYLPVLRRTGRLAGVPIDLVTRNNERVDCLASAIVERSESGDYRRTIAVYTEVSAQARLEQHYRELYRATPAMLHTVDSYGRITNVSDRWLETLGFRREEVLGRVITEFMGREMQETLGGGRLEDVIASGGLENEPRTYVTNRARCSRSRSRPPAIATRAAPWSLCSWRRRTSQRAIERNVNSRRVEENARLRDELERERDYLREEVQVQMNFGRIIGESVR